MRTSRAALLFAAVLLVSALALNEQEQQQSLQQRKKGFFKRAKSWVSKKAKKAKNFIKEEKRDLRDFFTAPRWLTYQKRAAEDRGEKFKIPIHSPIIMVPGTMGTSLRYRYENGQPVTSKGFANRGLAKDGVLQERVDACPYVGTVQKFYRKMALKQKTPKWQSLWIAPIALGMMNDKTCGFNLVSKGTFGHKGTYDDHVEVAADDGGKFGDVDASDRLKIFGTNAIGWIMDLFADDVSPLEDLTSYVKGVFFPYSEVNGDYKAFKDTADLFNAGHDWRRGDVDFREDFDADMKKLIEKAVNTASKNSPKKIPAVLAAHSQGCVNLFWFVKKMQAEDPEWVKQHIGALVPVSGPFQGAPSALAYATLGLGNGLLDTMETRIVTHQWGGATFNNGMLRFPREHTYVGEKKLHNVAKEKGLEFFMKSDAFLSKQQMTKPDLQCRLRGGDCMDAANCHGIAHDGLCPAGGASTCCLEPMWELMRRVYVDPKTNTVPAWRYTNAQRAQRARDAHKATGLSSPTAFQNKNFPGNTFMKARCEKFCQGDKAQTMECFECVDLPDVPTYFVYGESDRQWTDLRYTPGKDWAVNLPHKEEDFCRMQCEDQPYQNSKSAVCVGKGKRGFGLVKRGLSKKYCAKGQLDSVLQNAPCVGPEKMCAADIYEDKHGDGTVPSWSMLRPYQQFKQEFVNKENDFCAVKVRNQGEPIHGEMPAHFGFMDFLIKLSQEVGKNRDGGKDGTVSFAQKHLNEGGESVYYRTHDDIKERSFLGKKKRNIHNGFAQIMECAQSKPADVLFGSRDKCNDFPAQL